MIPQTDTVIDGRYRILGVLGRGGMGGVFAAQDERLGRRVALKMLRPDLAADAQARQRFLREARIAAGIRHPNVVRTFDVGDSPEGPYLIQELLEGRTLGLEQLPPRRALAVARDIASALRAIHEQGFLHCDVKPANIMLVDGETRAVLLDFGIARDAGADSSSLIATPLYLAPERTYGDAPSAASDLYALGIVLYVMLSGQPPFTGPDIHAVLLQHRSEPLPPLALADPAARALELVAIRLAAKQPSKRYVSAAELLVDLQRVEDGAGDGRPTRPLLPPATDTLHTAVTAPVMLVTPAHRRSSRMLWLLPLLLLLLGGTMLLRPAADVRSDTPAPVSAPLEQNIAAEPTPQPPTPTVAEPTPVAPTVVPPTAVPEPAIVAPTAEEDRSNRGRGNGRKGNQGDDEDDEDDD